jgi:biopolymer transport protein ExbD
MTMGASHARSTGPITSINVTPLVDVVLVLLIVLMVTSHYLATKSIPLDLPKAATGDATPASLAVSILASGTMFVDGNEVDEDALRRAVRTARATNEDLRATIAADGATAHARVVHVIDLLRQEKLVKFAINIDPEQRP